MTQNKCIQSPIISHPMHIYYIPCSLQTRVVSKSLVYAEDTGPYASTVKK